MTRTTVYDFSADHVCDDWRFSFEPIKVHQDDDGFAADHGRLGYGKRAATAEAAISNMLREHGCTNVVVHGPRAAAPATVNGCAVLRDDPTKSGGGTMPGRVVFVQRDGKHQPFITAWQSYDPANGGCWQAGWNWGHYFDSYDDAARDFAARCKRGY